MICVPVCETSQDLIFFNCAFNFSVLLWRFSFLFSIVALSFSISPRTYFIASLKFKSLLHNSQLNSSLFI